MKNGKNLYNYLAFSFLLKPGKIIIKIIPKITINITEVAA